MNSALTDVIVNKKTLVYVGGLEETVTETVLESAFIPFGTIKSVLIPKQENTGKPRGFAFVEFEEVEDAEEAMRNMNDSELYGRVISCNIANPKSIKSQAVWAQSDAWTSTLKENADEIDADRRQQSLQSIE